MIQAPETVDLNDLARFVAVYEARSFTAASDRLGMPKARVSVAVRRLEAALGQTLLVRTTRRVNPTDAGHALYAQAAPLLDGLGEAVAASRQAGTRLSGRLRIACPVDLAERIVAESLARFALAHPSLSIHLSATDTVTDMLDQGIDLSIRVGWLKATSHRAVKLGQVEQWLVAAPAHLARHGTPDTPTDLAHHPWIALDLLPTPLTWRFDGPAGERLTVRMSAHLSTDAPGGLRGLLRSGAGCSVQLSTDIAADVAAGRLVRLLPQWRLPACGIYAVYPPGRHLLPAARAFVDVLRADLAKPSDQ